MRINNVSILKKNFPRVYEKIKDEKEESAYKIIYDDGLCVLKNGVVFNVNSNVNKEYEAEIVISHYKHITNDSVVLLVGVADGYLIDHLLQRFPKVEIKIFEPSLKMFRRYLEHNDLPIKNLTGLCIGGDHDEWKIFSKEIVSKTEKNIQVLESPTYKNFFGEDVNAFLKIFHTFIHTKRSSVGTNYSFQKRWIRNSLGNFFNVLNSSNIMGEGKEIFRDKPVILAASGPSLTDEIENLKKIREENSAYIFAVGSAVTILVKNGVIPHATLSYDPGKTQHLNHDILRENNIRNVPLIYGTTVSELTVNTFPGEKLYLITSQDTASTYFLEPLKTHVIMDAPSIAVITLQLIVKLGMGPVIFVGQNLAYRNEKWYAEGQRKGYEKLDQKNTRKSDIIYLKDVYGNEVSSTNKLLGFKTSLEQVMKMAPETKFINSTKFGAHIEGSVFVELDEVMQTELKPDTALEEWYKEYHDQKYDYIKINEKNIKLYNSFKNFTDQIHDIEKILNNIMDLANNNNLKEVSKSYSKLDQSFNTFSKSPYYRVVIAPMNRVHFEKLSQEIGMAKQNKNLRIRARKTVESYQRYLKICRAENLQQQELVMKFIKYVDLYCKSEARKALKKEE